MLFLLFKFFEIYDTETDSMHSSATSLENLRLLKLAINFAEKRQTY